MGWAGLRRPGLRGMEVGRAEPRSVLLVEPRQVVVRQGARRRGCPGEGTFSGVMGPDGFEPSTNRL